jgi:hypothetical protein
MHPPPKAASHHWWPKALSKYWKDDSGLVHRISWDGQARIKPPKSFGHTRNDNNVKLASTPTPWDFTFERTFQDADDAFRSLIEWLLSLSSPIAPTIAPFPERVTPIALTNERHLQLAQCCASLIVRSPSLRNRVRVTTESYRKAFGIRDFDLSQSLVGMNIRGGQEELSRSIASGGKFAVLLSGEHEFIFGDGFLHNVSAVNGPIHSPRFLIPLTPEVAITYTRPSSYRSFPKAFVMNLTRQEVSFVNLTVQIYSKQHVFFREIYPVINEAFTRGEHLQLEFDNDPWLGALHNTIADTYFGKDHPI